MGKKLTKLCPSSSAHVIIENMKTFGSRNACIKPVYALAKRRQSGHIARSAVNVPIVRRILVCFSSVLGKTNLSEAPLGLRQPSSVVRLCD